MAGHVFITFLGPLGDNEPSLLAFELRGSPRPARGQVLLHEFPWLPPSRFHFSQLAQLPFEWPDKVSFLPSLPVFLECFSFSSGKSPQWVTAHESWLETIWKNLLGGHWSAASVIAQLFHGIGSVEVLHSGVASYLESDTVSLAAKVVMVFLCWCFGCLVSMTQVCCGSFCIQKRCAHRRSATKDG